MISRAPKLMTLLREREVVEVRYDKTLVVINKVFADSQLKERK
jgi:hypothetical protein